MGLAAFAVWLAPPPASPAPLTAPLFVMTANQALDRLDGLWRAARRKEPLHRVAWDSPKVMACYGRELSMVLDRGKGPLRSVELSGFSAPSATFRLAETHLLGLAGGRPSDVAPALAATQAAYEEGGYHKLQLPSACLQVHIWRTSTYADFTPGRC